MCDSNETEEMDTRNAELCEYMVKNYKTQILSYSEEVPQNILSLNLTNNGITSLDEHIFDMTPNLQSIDLSYNLLKDLSNLSNIDLPQLIKLNLKFNQISNFSFLSNFKSLEDLDISGNQFDCSLTYWAVCQLPKLKLFNGEDTTDIRKYINFVELRIISCIDTIFKHQFEVNLKRTESGIIQMKEELINTLMKKCGIIEEAQLALKNNIEYFVSNKLNEVIKNIMKKVIPIRNLSNNITIKLNDSQLSVFDDSKFKIPKKVVPKVVQFSDIESDILGKAIAEAIGELNVEITIPSIPSVSILKTKTNQKVPNNNLSIKRENSREPLNLNSNALKRKSSVSEGQPQKTTNTNSFPLSYELIKITRKHSRKTEVNDSMTSIWDIKFKPIGKNYRGSHLVVTCGANIVNLFDLKTWSICQRYEDNNSLETFNCIVWNDFIVNITNDMTRDLSLLCVGGTKKDNKLTNILFLNADDMSDCFKMKAHKQSVNCLLFHPTKKNLLFSGSYDRTIIVWKLDSGKMTNISRLSSLSVTKLKEIDCNNRILSSVFAKNLNVLVVSGEDGIVLIKPNQNPNQSTDKKTNTYRVDIPEKKKVIDGLVMIGSDSNLFAFRLKEFIIIADLKKMIDSVDGKGTVPLIVITRLRYCSQKCDYFYMTIESRLLCYGTAEGQILLYYLKDSILKSYEKENLMEPIRVLPKPDLNKFWSKNESFVKPLNNSMFVNIAAISPNHEYIVSGTNTNMICVWKRKPLLSQNSSQSSSQSEYKKLKTVETI